MKKRKMKSKAVGNTFNLRSEFGKAKTFLLECRQSIMIACAVFAFTFLVGFLFPIFFADEIRSFVESLVSSLEGKSASDIVWFIFFNNVKASFMAVITGVGLAVIPFMIVVVNGYLLGFVSRFAVESEGIFILWRLLPHGIFELPAILLSVGMGLKVGLDLFRVKNKRSLRENLFDSLRVFVLVIIPLLFIAAIIEGLLISFVK